MEKPNDIKIIVKTINTNGVGIDSFVTNGYKNTIQTLPDKLIPNIINVSRIAFDIFILRNQGM